MSGDVQMELWLHQYKMEALSSVLAEQGYSVEDRMQEMLDGLYAQLVPVETQREIHGRIEAERAAALTEQEAARKYAVFRIRENGGERCFQLDRGMEFLEAARLLRSCLRSGGGAAEYMRLLRPEEITADQFQQMSEIRMENTGRVAGAFDLDFDSQRCSALNIMDGWKTYDMRDVSVAVYRSQRKQYSSVQEQWNRFLDKLEGKELTGDVPEIVLRGQRRLTADDISFSGEIMQSGKLLDFYMDINFDADAVFGTHVCTPENDNCLNVYADHDMESGQVCSALEVYLVRADGADVVMWYPLCEDERIAVESRMDAYCRQQTGQTLAEYSAQLMEEAGAAPEEMPEADGPALTM